jgi:hypothetical protein
LFLRSNWGGSAAVLGTLVVGLLATSRIGQRPSRDGGDTLMLPPPAEPGGTNRKSSSPANSETADLERPANEMREFFSAESNAGKGPSLRISDLADEIGTLARERGFELHFRVALVPDPIDSYTGGDFDTYVSALRDGANDEGWLLDRHWFPWEKSDSTSQKEETASEAKTKEEEEKAGKGRPAPDTSSQHRRSPGIILFRKSAPLEGKPPALLAVFVVGESPLTGIQKRPFVNALRFISAMISSARVPLPKGTIQILGPFSSGSVMSCVLALDEWCKAGAHANRRRHTTTTLPTISFLSGSATGDDIETRLETPYSGPCASLNVTFDRTVVSDTVLTETALDFFEKRFAWDPTEVGLLVEVGTSYGSGYASQASKSRLKDLFVVRVPAALGSVRTEVERSRKAGEPRIGGVTLPAYALDLRLDERHPPKDVFAEFNPMTPPVTELKLDALLSSLTKHRIRHLGLVFTDVRDKLFLAEKLKAYAPHVSLFTFESSVAYVHPRSNPFTDGMIVVSSYSLSDLAWHLTGWGRQIGQFSSDAQLGMFIATRRSLRESSVRPSRRQPSPSVWISAVGNGRMVPLGAIQVGPASPGRPAVFDRIGSRLQAPLGFRLCLWFATVGVLFISASFAAGCAWPARGGLWPSTFFRPLERGRRTEVRQRCVWSLLLVGTAIVAWVALVTVYLVPFVLRDRFGLTLETSSSSVNFFHTGGFSRLEEFLLERSVEMLRTLTVLFVVLAAILGLAVGRSMDERPTNSGDHNGSPKDAGRSRSVTDLTRIRLTLRHRLLCGASLAGVAAVSVVAARYALSSLRSGSLDSVSYGTFTFLRAASAPGGLSPLFGILLLVAGLAVLIAFQIHRLSIWDGWRCGLPIGELLKSSELPLRSVGRLQGHLERRIKLALPRSRSFWIVIVALLGPFLVTFFFRFEAACDSLGWAKSFACLFAFLLVASLASFSRFVSLWRALRRLIVREEWSSLVPAFETSKDELEWRALRAWGSNRKDNYSTLVKSCEKLRRLAASLPSFLIQRSDRQSSDADKDPVTRLRDASKAADENLSSALDENARGNTGPERAARVRVLNELDKGSIAAQGLLNDIGGLHRSALANSGWLPSLRADISDFLALRTIAYIRYVFGTIRNSLLAFTTGILFLLAGLASFHFQPIRSVYVVLWSVIGVVALWTVAIFIQMDRNSLLSRMDNTTPGELNPIKSGFLRQVATFVLPPVVALVLTQFPQIGQPLLGWADPLIRLLQ